MKQRNLFETEVPPWEVDAADDRAFAAVALRESPFGPYDYLVPDALRGKVQPGCRVRVPLGHGNRTVVGYCVKLHLGGKPAEAGSTVRRWKEVRSVVDPQPLLTVAMLRLTEWMADYYLCPWGQVLEAVIPTGVRTQAGTREMDFFSVSPAVTARLDEWRLPRKQRAILEFLAAATQSVPLSQIMSAIPCSAQPVRELQRKHLVNVQTERVHQSVPEQSPVVRQNHLELNADQQRALQAVLVALHAGRPATVLVHGVTGSGKTELYMRAIEEVLHFGRQAIVLVPEISLTPQTVSRFRARFEHVAVLHSHLSAAERNWHWQRIAKGQVQVVVGARSAIFAPAPHLGLIVLDEEHDASFKQDLVPRYHARDVALQRAELERIPVLLGSATPAMESWYRARRGDYQLVELPRRILDRPLPEVGIIDLRIESRNRYSRGAISRPLRLAMQQALADAGQVILLLNRRGYSTTIQCPACGLVVKCPECDLALTHHRADDQALCHYCDYQMLAPAACPNCRFEGIRYSGIGTERLEAEVRSRFPQATCLRMDSDSMRKPGSHEQAFQRFRDGDVQVLLGTQMIAKGLDFPNVTLVGVINADVALHFPDFRAAEQTFQLVTQVAGRTGRGPRGGRVLVQTYSPDHLSIMAAARHDYDQFAVGELPVRQEHFYPPFSSMIRLIVRGSSESQTDTFAQDLAGRVRAEADRRSLPLRVLGPAPAPIAKLRGKFRFHILLTSEDGCGLRTVVQEATAHVKAPDDVLWVADVDPMEML
jgi:primosomal protein N' (replication factor Y)